jgi:hypothetical protein
MEKTLILGECKWSTKEIDRDVLETLAQKTVEFVPSEGNWRVYYYGFARGGWSSAAHTFATKFCSGKSAGENWRVVEMSLLDLSQVDQDLRDWSQGKDEDV